MQPGCSTSPGTFAAFGHPIGQSTSSPREADMLETQAETTATSDETLLARARRRDETAVRTIIRQNNRRLFRMARAILKDDSEAEDAVQESYVRAPWPIFARRRR